MIFEYSGNECSGQIKQVGEPIEVIITEWNAKGLLTRIEGLRAFLPKGELVKRVNRFTELKENGLVLLFLTSIGQHILLSYVLIEPTLDIAYESTPEVTPEIQSESEEEATEMQTEQSKHVSCKRSWLVDVIDDEGIKCKIQLTVNDVWFLSSSEKILVNWNTEDQPIDNVEALLNRFLGRVAKNMNIFPISYQSWRKIPKDYKEDVLKNTIQVKFEVDSDARVKYIFKSLNTKWSEYRQQLWQQRDDGTRNRDDLTAMGPEGVNKDHWASFADYRLSSRTKEICKKNKDNRKRQTVPHTGGSKSIARKKDEMEQELGRKVSRGEVWIATHKHGNGDFVNDEAREISVNALQSQLDEQNRILIEQHKRFEERDRRFEAMMNFFAQNYQGHLPSNLAMFNNPPVSDQGSVPTNETNSQRQEGCG
ncbi:hypothetical protein Fmac_025234 [Flemingia macrophylla]|uniref:S1 motif domain-containing protein n=1 Tax=Flemingia macrophylla TaxID=520843 RepID=A0ABD1LRM6_9FABA